LLGGETPAMAATVGDAISHVRSGNIRVLAVAAPARLPDLPEVPTFAELGYAVEFLNWRGFFAVPGLRADERDVYARLLEALSSTPAWKEALHRHGWVQVLHTGDEFARYLDRQEAQIATLMRAIGFLQ